MVYMANEDLIDSLRGFATAIDLTDYEIQALVAIIEHGDLTASDIADQTGIPQPRVYDTVRSLADRGFVELRETRPLRVIALDPAETFGSLGSTLDTLTNTLEMRYQAPTPSNEAASLVKSRSSILRYFRDVIESAEYELTIALTPDLLERFEEELRAAIDRDVRTALVLTPASEAPDPETFPYERIASTARARRGVTTPVLAVADGSYSVYATQAAVSRDGAHYAAIFNRSALGFLVLGFFGTVIWSTADRTLLGDQPPGRLPRTYASIRQCVRDLRDIDGSRYVRVFGRDVLTGEAREVTGRVISTRLGESEEVATMVIDVNGDEVAVGGRVAAYEDIEAHEIELNAQPFPPA